MAEKKQQILILGGEGLVGHAVYRYLKTQPEFRVRASHHSPTADWFKFDGQNPEKDLKKIFKTGHYDYVINTIGLLQHDNKAGESDYIAINTNLPLMLAKLTANLKFNLIHVSTDAVFPTDSGPVNEKSLPNPADIYGRTKLAGEVTGDKCLTIRTSIIGMDPYHQRGLLEWALTQNRVTGFTNQTWSGCTNVQLAQFIENTIKAEMNGLIHFAPLGPMSKYALLSKWAELNHKTAIGTKDREVTRYLTTINPSIHRAFKRDIKQALTEVANFEKGAKYG